MDGLFTLIALGAVMAGASFLAGSLPLSLTLTPSQLRLVSTIGMGVLVGTSLIVIIPEGVETLYSASQGAVGHTRRDLHPVSNSPERPSALLVKREDVPDAGAFLMPGPVLPSGGGLPPATPTQPGVVGIMEEGSVSPAPPNLGADSDGHAGSPHAWIGIALIGGFIVMFLIDKVPQHLAAAKPKVRTHHIALNNLGRRFHMATSLDRDDETEGFLGSSSLPDGQDQSFATTTGLVIHAAADGIALGASSTASSSSLSLIIFFAIMVHKAPAAFGLTSVLLKQGVSKRTARTHLILFSLAAPAGSLLTWAFARLIGAGRSSSAHSTTWWTGLLLLFSAGTFLYVAMHSMQEATIADRDSHMNGHTGVQMDGGDAGQRSQKPSLRDLSAACFGMILPLFLQIGHAH